MATTPRQELVASLAQVLGPAKAEITVRDLEATVNTAAARGATDALKRAGIWVGVSYLAYRVLRKVIVH